MSLKQLRSEFGELLAEHRKAISVVSESIREGGIVITRNNVKNVIAAGAMLGAAGVALAHGVTHAHAAGELPLCPGAASVGFVDQVCHLNGQHVALQQGVDSWTKSACSSPVCSGPIVHPEFKPFAVGSPCFKMEIRNVCAEPAVCVMPPPDAPDARGIVWQKAGKCAIVK